MTAIELEKGGRGDALWLGGLPDASNKVERGRRWAMLLWLLSFVWVALIGILNWVVAGLPWVNN